MSEIYIGGIPSSAFDLNKEGVVVGKSGEEIFYKNTDKRIELDQRDFSCYAFVEDEYFRLVLKTISRDEQERRPPDLFARLFAQMAHKKLLEQGNKIKGFKAVWKKGTDNYESYLASMKKGLTSIESARSTWSGKLASELGYSSRTDVFFDETDEYMDVVFS